jgi:hypothetical protein
MQNHRLVDHDDEQLKLELRAMAELLLDIYEYRLQQKPRPNGVHNAVLDEAQRDRMMNERSTNSEHNIK